MESSILDKQYEEWLSHQRLESPSTEEVREILTSELSMLSKMSVEEYTLYRKWKEIQERYPSEDNRVNTFFDIDEKTKYEELEKVKSNIWIPESPEDYKKLDPTLIWTDKDKNLMSIWNILRTFTSTMLNNPNIGRSLFFISVDEVTGKYLGVICCSSDFMDLTPRDKYIGWSRDIKTTKKMINHTTIGSTIVPVQPLGFSFVGGKLLALQTISDITEDAWNKRYGDKLVGYTTTSLYGSFSQYQNLKYWTKRGHTSGSIKFEPSKETVKIIRKWLKFNYPRRYWEWYHAKKEHGLPLKRDHKQRSLSFAYKCLNIPKELTESHHQRGIYFCPLFTNTNEYLRMEIDESGLIRRFDNNCRLLSNLWKEKYASKRIKTLLKDDRYSTETLFYDDLIYSSWADTKEKYLKHVGR